MSRRRSNTEWLIVGALIGFVALAGCKSPPISGDSVKAAVSVSAGQPDLTQTLRLNEWQSSAGEEPLEFVQRLARTAGGTWVGLTPRPLELVSWLPDRRSGKSYTVDDALKGLASKKTPLEREARSGYLLVYFGKKEELEAAKSGPVDEVIGLYVAAPTGRELVAALSDVLRVKIVAAHELFRTREAMLKVRQKQKPEEPDPRYAGYDLGEIKDDDADAPVVLELKSGDRTSIEELMEKLGSYIGAESRKKENGDWELLPLSEPHRVAQEIGRLQDVIKDKAGEGDEGFTSFAGRAGGAGEVEQEIPELADEAAEAFDSLALLGKQAVPTLAAYLEPERASRAQAAIRALSVMPDPEAHRALLDFGPRLTGKISAKARPFRKKLLSALVRDLSRELKPDAAAWLVTLAKDGAVNVSLRQTARMALLEAGRLEMLTDEKGRRDLAAGTIEFTVKEPKAKSAALAPESESAPPPSDSVSPIATAALPNGERWAVFTSGRRGNPDDLWLARSELGAWTEFLFTGQRFQRGGQYGGYSDGTPPPRGSCVLKLTGDEVTLQPPDKKQAVEFTELTKKIQDRDLMSKNPVLYQKLAQQYSELQGRVQHVLGKTLKFTVGGLRMDTDKDGLTDLLETRLGTDPKKADTDGDGISDQQDANPRIKPGAANDRTVLLQAVFAAMYGGDPSKELTVVLLDDKVHQEFVGANGPVLCVSPDEEKRRIKEINGLRTLEFGGPVNPSSTILRADGPCLLNDARTRAEIHFWTWPGAAQSAASMARRYYGNGGEGPKDYLATFVKKGSTWKLETIKPWKWKDSETAGTRRQMLEQMSNPREY